MVIYDRNKQILFIPERDDAVILNYDDIYQKGFRDGYQEGYDEAYGDNYQSGYTDGYAEGIVACSVVATSITLVVPSSIVGEADAVVEVSPSDADVDLTFTSSDPSIATIDENGHITVIQDGEVTFCVQDSKSGLQDCQTVAVERPYFDVTPRSITDNAGTGGTYTLNVTATGEWTVTWDAFPTPTPWCEYTPTSGTNSGTITVTLAPYTPSVHPGAGRMGDIIISDFWNRSITVEVGQEDGYVPPTPTQVTVQQLIAEGYATVVPPGGEYKAGTYVQILPTCPYAASQIVNLADVALNQEQLTAGTQNTIVWNQTLPSGWTEQDVINIYSGQSLNYTPRGEQFWDIKSGTTNFEITYTGNTYVTNDYSWGSYHSEGVFAPRWNQQQQGVYVQNGWLQTPANVVVNFTSTFSSVSQVMFTQMKTTTALTINQQAGTFACHDVTGMFEGDSALVTLNINGAFNYGTWRTQHNVFDGCTALTGIPYSTSWSREHANNTIYPHADGQRGSANAYHMFRGLNSLTYLGPTINMGAMSLSGCTYGGVNQAALTDTFFDCPELTDVRIINLNNNDWSFADNSTFTYIPKMSAASIEYLLNNVEDVTSQGGHSVTFAGTYKNSVSAAAIANAQSKGWNVIWDGDSPTPTGSTAVAITYSIPVNDYTTKITAGRTSSFSDATLDGTTPINLKSNYYTGRYTFADAGTHYIEFTPTGNTIGTRVFAYTCVKITDVTLPEGITTIGGECFSGCKMLTGVTLCNSLTTIGAQAFMNCSALTEIHLTSGVTTIDAEAFRNCSALTGITIPSSVTTLGAEVFEGCSGLTVMEFEGTTPPTPGNAYSLGDVSYTFPIYVPASSVSAYQTAYPNYASRITSK